MVGPYYERKLRRGGGRGREEVVQSAPKPRARRNKPSPSSRAIDPRVDVVDGRTSFSEVEPEKEEPLPRSPGTCGRSSRRGVGGRPILLSYLLFCVCSVVPVTRGPKRPPSSPFSPFLPLSSPPSPLSPLDVRVSRYRPPLTTNGGAVRRSMALGTVGSGTRTRTFNRFGETSESPTGGYTQNGLVQ